MYAIYEVMEGKREREQRDSFRIHISKTLTYTRDL